MKIRSARLWTVLAASGVLAADGIYGPLHLLSEAHHGASALPVETVRATFRAEDHDHHHPHEPHAAYDHLRLAVLVREPVASVPLPCLLRQDNALLESEPPPSATFTPELIAKPGRSPPPTPHQPRAPPLS